mgnify:FL=1
MNILFTCLVSLLFCIILIFFIIKDFVKSRNSKLNKNSSKSNITFVSFCKENIFSILAIVVLFFGCFIRLIYIDKYPVGLNQDEASSVYEAWSILNFGIDRNGQSFPVQFISWGSGQNVLYSYLMIPFISIFGLNTLSIRLPMALIGCISLVVFYYFMKSAFGDKKAVLFLFIFSIFPWHLMKSRWGLESNIFPDLILWAIFAMYMGIKKKSNWLVVLSGVIFGLSTYSYGTSYFFVPVLLILLYISLLIVKNLSLKQCIIHLCTTTVIALPMILFVIINFFDLDTLKLGPITIPKLPTVRFKEITAVGSSVDSNIFSNFIRNIKMLLTNDGNVLNYTVPYGLFFCNWLTIPIAIIGTVISWKLGPGPNFQASSNSQNQQNINAHQSTGKVQNSTCALAYTFINCFFVASLLLMFMVDGAINRINVIFIPLVFYTTIGIINLGKVWFVPFITYFILFTFMEYYYFTDYQTYISSYMNVGLKEAIIEASNLVENYENSTDANSSNNNEKGLTASNNKFTLLDNSKTLQNYTKLYIDTSVNQPYIFYLLYNEVPTPYYISNVQKSNEDAMFQTIDSIGNVYFTIPTTLELDNVYIFRQSTLEKYKNMYNNLGEFTSEIYGEFVVLYVTLF